MKIYDISMEINKDVAVWKDKDSKRPKFKVTAKYSKDKMNESRIDIDLHTGTHTDAYFHMLDKGDTIEKLPLDKFIGECIVLDLTNTKDKITLNDLKNFEIKKDDIVLLKTRNSKLEKFDFNFAYVDKLAAKFLADKEIKLVGVDNPGIERAQPGHETHKTLFKNNIPVVEGLDLSKIKPGKYFFIGMPLKIKNVDGSPIRAILTDQI